MNKLIKLSETHYIVVDDSEIKDKEPFLDMRDYPDVYDEDIYWAGSGGSAEFANTIGKKITHSTQPLETIKVPDEETYMKGFQHIKPLSLSEVEEAIYGYSAKRIAEENGFYDSTEDNKGNRTTKAFIAGFNAHKELVKDKLLITDKDLFDFLYFARTHSQYSDEAIVGEFIQSLLPKTEWECCISDGKLVLL